MNKFFDRFERTHKCTKCANKNTHWRNDSKHAHGFLFITKPIWALYEANKICFEIFRLRCVLCSTFCSHRFALEFGTHFSPFRQFKRIGKRQGRPIHSMNDLTMHRWILFPLRIYFRLYHLVHRPTQTDTHSGERETPLTVLDVSHGAHIALYRFFNCSASERAYGLSALTRKRHTCNKSVGIIPCALSTATDGEANGMSRSPALRALSLIESKHLISLLRVANRVTLRSRRASSVVRMIQCDLRSIACLPTCKCSGRKVGDSSKKNAHLCASKRGNAPQFNLHVNARVIITPCGTRSPYHVMIFTWRNRRSRPSVRWPCHAGGCHPIDRDCTELSSTKQLLPHTMRTRARSTRIGGSPEL